MMKPTLEELSETLELNKADGKHDRAVYGEVKQINSDQTYQVSLNGSDTTVKCARLSGAKVGDTVMVELLANGYAVVTGTVGGDTDASDAQASANAAVTAAGQAQGAASAASTAAAQAVTKADQASAAASAASTAAATADSKAVQAASAAATADSKAEAASTAAATADSKAAQAAAAAATADGKAVQAAVAASAAQTSASNASEYAARALGNLASVESVAETLSWITAHGTMAPTQDQQLDPTHVYFVQDNNGDYNVGGTRYSIVTEPDAADLSTYYELSIDQSLNNYVATHLAVDGEGLWLLPDAGGNKVLIATGAGSTYTTAGTYIIGKVNNVDTVFAKFASDGATMTAENGTLIAHLGYGTTQGEVGTETAPYYTFGVRNNNSVKGELSVVEGKNNTASGFVSHAEGGRNKATSAAAHAEGRDTTASGFCSHSEGRDTTASGEGSHSGGFGTIAQKDYQTAIGQYNKADNESTASKQKAFIIGNGNSNRRSNAFSVDWEGYVEAAGNIWSDGSIIATGKVEDGNGNVLGDKADASSVPTKTSELTNDSGFLSGTGLFKIVDLEVTNSSQIAAHGYQAAATYTVPAASRPSGMTLVGIVGYGTSNYRLQSTTHFVNGSNTIFANMANTSATAVSAGAKITFKLLYIKATSA